MVSKPDLGRKWVCAAIAAVVGSVGVVPLSYFVFGQRRQV
jgi:hypothetical protein